MQNPLDNAAYFLVSTLFDIYIFVLVIRLILVWVRANYFNPVSQVIIKLTNPLVIPLRRILPNVANIELSTLVLTFIFELIKYFLLGVVALGIPKVIGLPVLAVADMLKILLNIFFYAIFLQAILSWVQPGYSPMSQVLSQITSPIMRPIHRLIPPVAGFDLSPIPALIGLQLLIILLVSPLFSLGFRMAFG